MQFFLKFFQFFLQQYHIFTQNACYILTSKAQATWSVFFIKLIVFLNTYHPMELFMSVII